MTKQKQQITKTLKNGIEVLAKTYEGEIFAITYANRTQAYKAAAKMDNPENWAVYNFGRPFYVGRKIN